MAAISREEMVAAINAGGSVMLPSGMVVGRIEGLPTEADLARSSNDPAKVKAAREALQARKAALEAEIAALDEPAPAPAGTPLMSLEAPDRAQVQAEIAADEAKKARPPEPKPAPKPEAK